MSEDREKLIKPDGGYKDLEAYKLSEIIYDATVKFTARFIDRR